METLEGRLARGCKTTADGQPTSPTNTSANNSDIGWRKIYKVSLPGRTETRYTRSPFS